MNPRELRNGSTQGSITWILLGGTVWYFHWFRMARGDYDSVLRQVYFYLLTILGGAIAVLVALTIFIYRIFIWIFGSATVSAGLHFQFLGWVVPVILVGAAVWVYHKWLAQEEAAQAQERQLSAQRVHFYLMSFLGLGTLVSGLIILFGIILDLLLGAAGTSLTVTSGWWRNQLSLCLAR